MSAIEIFWTAPPRMAAGDTLGYNRSLPRFLPSAGWALNLMVAKALPQGGAKVCFQQMSVPDPTNSFHTWNVPNFMAADEAGEYTWYEEAVNAANNNETHEILRNDHFILGPNIAGGAATGELRTFAERALAKEQEKYLALAEIPFSETDQQRNRFVVEDREKCLERMKFWEAKVRNERQIEQARNGRTPDNVQEVVFQFGR